MTTHLVSPTARPTVSASRQRELSRIGRLRHEPPAFPAQTYSTDEFTPTQNAIIIDFSKVEFPEVSQPKRIPIILARIAIAPLFALAVWVVIATQSLPAFMVLCGLVGAAPIVLLFKMVLRF